MELHKIEIYNKYRHSSIAYIAISSPCMYKVVHKRGSPSISAATFTCLGGYFFSITIINTYN